MEEHCLARALCCCGSRTEFHLEVHHSSLSPSRVHVGKPRENLRDGMRKRFRYIARSLDHVMEDNQGISPVGAVACLLPHPDVKEGALVLIQPREHKGHVESRGGLNSEHIRMTRFVV